MFVPRFALLCILCYCYFVLLLAKGGKIDQTGDNESVDGVGFANEFTTEKAPMDLGVA